MKRSICLILALIIPFCFISCSSLPSAADYIGVLYRPYRASITVSEQGRQYSLSVALDDAGEKTFGFTEPVLLTGISYVFSDSACSMIYGDSTLPVSLSGGDTLSKGVCLWRELLTPTGDFSVSRTGKGEESKIIVTSKDAEYLFSEADLTPLSIITDSTEIIFTEFENEDLQEGEG